MVLRRWLDKNQTMPVTLLIVDDSDLIRNSLTGLLLGIPGAQNIRCAATLHQGLESVRSHWPTWVVLDLHLADGYAIPRIQHVKTLSPGVQIAVLTNDASEFNRIRCMTAGANWFFDKSTEFEILLDVVRAQAAVPSAPASTPAPLQDKTSTF
jgi:two-component system OmpR family response regulator